MMEPPLLPVDLLRIPIFALSIATRGYVLQTGEVVLSGPARDLLKNEMLRATYLGEMKTA